MRTLRHRDNERRKVPISERQREKLRPSDALLSLSKALLGNSLAFLCVKYFQGNDGCDWGLGSIC